jgi:hypothetical protein
MPSTVPQECLLIFARYPEPGKVKTRLIPALGAEGAASVYREMAEHTSNQARAIAHMRGVSPQLWFTGGHDHALRTWLGDDLTYRSQPEGDLGHKLTYAFQSAFDEGHQAVAAIGTDCPSLDSATLLQAFEALKTYDLVLGPAADGGYYLIGLRHFIPELFKGIVWSTAQVLQQTEAIAKRLALTQYRLPSLTDVDYPEDVVLWQQIKTMTQR